ncbi:DUF5103 domain-containing protein [Chryseotalea sanaruensis]|uniref:DUF5103 domain-containing protein n=1 Tax=Chryseotalea sanaruensis TaxID=2482724 RepID=A0A401U6Y5_9BACT|nr:type IX secretion system plug protein domain-containing protein [Chryseotalea sanaruensis]GCC50556.1 DUF5103 domain-containing protein [Chryseotalea sanaruensis]
MKKLLVLLLLASCTPLSYPTTGEVSYNLFDDGVFSSTIKTVQLYPDKNDATNVLLPASVPIQEQNLRLEFDDLVTAYQSYTVRISHCNSDWTKSSLSNLDFLMEYNSFPINQYAFSSDTHIPYLHYWFIVPSVKLSGNYVLTVYLDDSKPVLSKRFMVYSKQVQLSLNTDLSGAGQLNNKQGISLSFQYPNLDVINASTQFEVQIRQNQRWDNLITNIPPAFIREAERAIEYRVNDEDYMHDGGNEYRFIDLRTIINTGQNLAKIDRSVKPYTAYAGLDKSRQHDRYSQYLDFNGNFVIMNYDYTLQYSENYIKTVFTLSTGKKIDGTVHLEGKLVNNSFSKESEMLYDSARKEYRKELLLKQGWYNYQYIIEKGNKKSNLLEGNHFETENLYEVLVYYKSLQPRADLLVGYLQLNKNPR